MLLDGGNALHLAELRGADKDHTKIDLSGGGLALLTGCVVGAFMRSNETVEELLVKSNQLGAYGARWNLVEDHGTTHVSVVDADRNAVAMTSTINTNFGSKVVSRSTGILLNNEMDDFSVPNETNHYGLAPSAANFIAPRRKPLSSMSPTVVLDANQNPPRVVAVAGASGGPRIITAVAQVLLNVLARGMSPLEAVVAPRVHHQLVPNVVFAESLDGTVGDGAPRRVDAATAAALRKRGHVVEFSSEKTAVAQLIVVDGDTDAVHAVSDARKGGAPAAQDRDRDERSTSR